MTEIENLMGMLEEWREVSEVATDDFDALIFSLEYSLGCTRKLGERSKTLDQLKNRLLILVDNQKIDEGFLVAAVVENVTFRLERTLTSIAKEIIENEESMEEFSSQGKPELAEIHRRILSKIKTTDYVRKAESKFLLWQQILADKYTVRDRRIWEIDRQLEFAKKI